MINYRFSAIIARVDNHTRRSAYLKSSECANTTRRWTSTPTGTDTPFSCCISFRQRSGYGGRRVGRQTGRQRDGQSVLPRRRATLTQGHTHRQTQRPRDPGGSAQSAAADTPRPTNGNCADSQTANHRRQRKINIEK